MKILGNILIGVLISIAVFFFLFFFFSEEIGPFFIITILLGIIIGLQIAIYKKIK